MALACVHLRRSLPIILSQPSGNRTRRVTTRMDSLAVRLRCGSFLSNRHAHGQLHPVRVLPHHICLPIVASSGLVRTTTSTSNTSLYESSGMARLRRLQSNVLPLDTHITRGGSACMHTYTDARRTFLAPLSGFCSGTRTRHIGGSLFGSVESSAWAQAVAEAEKIVGYPTSFMGLRCLLSDELSNVALQVRKLVTTTHPLVKTAKSFIYDGKQSIQTRGLIVLLVSKAAGPSKQNHSRRNMVRGIYPSQRNLAEITELIHMAFLVHRGIVDLRDLLPIDGPLGVMEFGNKMAVLSGDFLLASACSGLGRLRNTHVVELVSQAISDLTRAAFMVFSDSDVIKDGMTVARQGLGVAEWAEYVYLSSGSLISKSCRAALELAGHGEEMQTLAFEFGKNIALAQQLNEELMPFAGPKGSPPLSISLTSAPVLLHVQHTSDPQRVRNQTKSDIEQLYKDVRAGPAVQRCIELCRTYRVSALTSLMAFPESEARDALRNMVDAIRLP